MRLTETRVVPRVVDDVAGHLARLHLPCDGHPLLTRHRRRHRGHARHARRPSPPGWCRDPPRHRTCVPVDRGPLASNEPSHAHEAKPYLDWLGDATTSLVADVGSGRRMDPIAVTLAAAVSCG